MGKEPQSFVYLIEERYGGWVVFSAELISQLWYSAVGPTGAPDMQADHPVFKSFRETKDTFFHSGLET